MIENMVALDADGCADGRGGPMVSWDLPGMELLRRFFRKMKDKAPQWVVALMTGRSEDWGLALIEALAMAEIWPNVYSGFENGALARRHGDWDEKVHPLITRESGQQLFHFLDQYVIPSLVERGGRIEPKRTCRTITAPRTGSVLEFKREAESIFRVAANKQGVGNLFNQTRIICGGSAVDFVLLDKEAGLRFVADLNQVDLDNICVVGDGTSDLDMARIAGLSGAPANASVQVKQEMDISALAEGPRGVIQILKSVIFDDHSQILRH